MKFIFTKLGITTSITAVFIFGYFAWSVLGDTTINTTLNVNPDLNTSLVGHWTFDGPDMLQNVADTSGQGNTGSLILGASGNTSTTTTSGKIGQALYFDGVDDYVESNNNIGITGAASRTITFWAKLADTSAQDLVAIGTNGSNLLFAAEVQSSKWWLGGYGSGNDWNTGVTPSTGVWQFHALTYDGTKANWYVDASKLGGGFTHTYNTANAHVRIGARGSGSMNSTASIDEVRIYNRALTAEEVGRLYDLGQTTHINTTLGSKEQGGALSDGLVGHWTFDGPDMLQNVADTSGQGNNGSLTGQTSTTTVPGKIGQALYFDGGDDRIIIPRTSMFDSIMYGNTDSTISVWFKKDSYTYSVNNGYVLVENCYYAGTYSFFATRSNYGNERLEFLTKRDWSGGGFATADLNLQADTWYHAVVTQRVVDSSYIEGKIYLDGQLKTTNSTVDRTKYPNQASDLYISKTVHYTGSSDVIFDGIIDDVRMYNRVLSAKEIGRLYDLGH